ncbi:dTDP-4-dehydrorhamnose reductase [Paracoccus aminovorans]|uniref:dTDP-4-dehydrorhamnose reductase n=1 Tax=Paracoccus aminovorans TaxID=34004 RepID=UPI0007839762|nr:dTDP-4-dehydrorhamnose reductase [Paracoccus aminovorans]MDQ7776738.1 dTDP-4-dehydrorhamnose reductase [Paracoccus aminovorans]
MDLLVFGQSGQVAQELARLAPQARFLTRAQADLSDPEACAAAIRASGCAAVLNAAAHTAVDRAESEPELAHRINAEAPAAMARTCADLGLPFLSISTDYVFDGSGAHPWVETDPTGPLGVYGASKLAGERGIASAGGQWAVLRTSWVFSAHGANFVKTMLRLGRERDELRVVADQHGGPTPAEAIARACLTMLAAMRADPAQGGLYHFAGSPDTTWADFARAIMAGAGLGCRIIDIPTSDYPTPARRPANSRLDCAAILRDFGISRPDWQAGLAKILQELTA